MAEKTIEERVDDITEAFDLLLRFLIQRNIVGEYQSNQFDTLLGKCKEDE